MQFLIVKLFAQLGIKKFCLREIITAEKKNPFFEMDHPPLGLSCFAKKRRENWSNFASALAAHVFLHLAC